MYRILRLRFFLLLLLPVHLWAQETTVIDHKGTKIRVTSNSVTTSPTATATPVVGDIWFNTSSNTAEVYDGSQWKPIELGALPLWKTPASGGTYSANDLVNHGGVLYKNLTGTNSTTTPDADTTNWEATGGGDVVPLWKTPASGRSYTANDIVNRSGVLYRNLTGTNSTTTPDADSTNWVSLGGVTTTGAVEYSSGTITGLTLSANEEITTNTLSGNITKSGSQFLLRAGKTYELIAGIEGDHGNTISFFGVAWRTAADDQIGARAELAPVGGTWSESVNPVAFAIYAPTVDTYVSLDATFVTGLPNQSLSGQYTIKEIVSGGGTGMSIYNVTDAYNSGDSVINNNKIYQANAAISASTAFAIGTTGATWKEISQADILKWVSGGTYSTNDLAIYNGIIYKNLTGTNSTTTPNADTTNWEATGGGDVVPLWKTLTNGGSYATNDIVNHSGVLYKNLTGTNSTTAPNVDATNWLRTGGGDVVPFWKTPASGGSYTANDLVNHGGVLYRNKTGTNSTTAPNVDATNWLKTGLTAYDAANAYALNDTVVKDGLIYQTNAAVPAGTAFVVGTTGATWTALTANANTLPNYLQGEIITGAFVVGNMLDFNVDESRGITYTTNTISLKGGSTYLLRAALAGRFDATDNNQIRYQWENDSGVAIGNESRQMPGSSWQGYTEIPEASAVYTPSADTQVHLIVTKESAEYIGHGTNHGYVQVIELSRGGGTGLAIHDVANAYAQYDTVVKDGLIYQANAAVPAGTAFAVGTTGATWRAIGAGDSVPFWRSNSNGGTYVTNAIVNHGGVLYRNKTATNTNTDPSADTTNWEAETRDAVPFWKSVTDGGDYSANDIINRNGVLYKNKTGTNSDTTPNIDDTNWVRVDQSLGNTLSLGGGVLIRHNWPSVGWNLGVDADGDDKFYSSNPSYRMIFPTTGSDAGILQLKGTRTGTLGAKRTTETEVVHAAFSPDSNIRLNGILNTDTFSTDWQSNTDGGTYLTNAIVAYNGVFYRNLTGTNSNATPDSDITNWTTAGANNVLVKAGRDANLGGLTVAAAGAGTPPSVRWDGVWNVEYIDTHNAFDLATTTFTAPMDGWYEVFTSFRINTNVTNSHIYWSRNFNDTYGNPIHTIYSGPDDDANPRGKVIVGLIYLDAGDTLDLRNRFGGATTTTIGNGSNVVIKRIR